MFSKEVLKMRILSWEKKSSKDLSKKFRERGPRFLDSQIATDVVLNPALGWHYIPPSQLQSVTALWPVPNYTAW